MSNSDNSPGAAAHTTPGVRRTSLDWVRPDGMILLSIFNTIMRVLTFGIYHFWGKTEERRRIWSGARLEQQPLQYTGTGWELFIGFLIVFGLVLLPAFLAMFFVHLWWGQKSTLTSVITLIFYIILGFLFGAALYRAARYRLSRTTWRGIRAGLDGDGWDYAWTFFWTALLIPLTLGWIMPWRTTKLQGLMTNRMRFGDRYFSFSASSGYLYGKFAVVWVSVLLLALIGSAVYGAFVYSLVPPDRPTMPIELQFRIMAVVFGVMIVGYFIYLVVSSWYRARMFNHFARHTTYEGVAFEGRMTGRGLAWLSVTNYLLVLFTLGILTPVAQARSARYMIDNLSFDGAVDFDAIVQTAPDNNQRGEGLAQAFDVDAF